ncbi:uncharacterized protein LOC144142871 isoform X2 [Haemaphysalis longicornis]
MLQLSPWSDLVCHWCCPEFDMNRPLPSHQSARSSRALAALEPDRGTSNGDALIANACNSTDIVVINNPLQVSVPVQLAPSPANKCEAKTLVSDVLPTNHKSSAPHQAPETTTPPQKMDKLFSELSSSALLSAARSTDDTTLPAAALARLATKLFTEVRAGTVTSQPPTGSPASRSAVRGSVKQGATNKRPAVHDQTVAAKSAGVPHSGAPRVAKTVPRSKTVRKVNRKMNAKDVSKPVASRKSKSKVKTSCGGKRRHLKLLTCVDPECGVRVESCPDHVCVPAPPKKKARIRSRPAVVAQGATSPNKKKRGRPSSKKKAQRSKHTQTVSSSREGSVSLFLSITNGSAASTQVNHRWQAEKGCLTRSVNCIPSGSNARLTTTPVPACQSGSTSNPSHQKRLCEPQLVTHPRNFSPYLASLLSDSRAVEQGLTEHKDSGRESATGLLAASDQEPSSPRVPEVEEMSYWNATKIKQEVAECENDDSVEHRAEPCEVSNEELILPDVPDTAGLFNGTRIKEEVENCEDNLANQKHLVTEESEAVGLLGATWIQQELMKGEDNCVEHCTGPPVSHRPEEPNIKQEPMECGDSSAGAVFVVPLVVPKQESPSLQQPELLMDPGYLLARYEADGIAGITQQEDFAT